jgi:tight adherence protein C
MATILSLLAAIAVFAVTLVIDKVIADKKAQKNLRARIMPDGSYLTDTEASESELKLSRDPSPLAARLLSLLHKMGINTEEAAARLSIRFAQAGNNSPDAPIYYLFFQRIGVLLLLLLALYIYGSATADNKLMMLMLSLLIAVIAVFGPKLYLQNSIDKRKKILQRSFPDTLDLLLICVESGLALDASLARVCNELGNAYPEITAELNRTRLELALLNDRVRALNNLGDRTDMGAFRSLISSLVQSERFGTSLTDTLRVLSDEFRLERLALAETKAARLPVLMTIPLIFLLMPALFIVVLGPAIVSISKNGEEITGKKKK